MIYLILIAHLVGDFFFQTDKMATNKSTSNKWLASHIMAYTSCLLPFGLTYALVNGLTHYAVDYVSSRFTSYYYKKGDRHKFFGVIGIDQTVHVMILIATIPLSMWSY